MTSRVRDLKKPIHREVVLRLESGRPIFRGKLFVSESVSKKVKC